MPSPRRRTAGKTGLGGAATREDRASDAGDATLLRRCSRNVLEAQDSLAWTGAWFLCPPGVTKRDETSKLLPAGESLVVSSLVGINEKRGKGGGRARPDWWRNEGKVCVHSKTMVPCRVEPLRDAANKRIPGCQKKKTPQLSKDSRSRPISCSRGRRGGISGSRWVNMLLVLTKM